MKYFPHYLFAPHRVHYLRSRHTDLAMHRHILNQHWVNTHQVSIQADGRFYYPHILNYKKEYISPFVWVVSSIHYSDVFSYYLRLLSESTSQLILTFD